MKAATVTPASYFDHLDSLEKTAWIRSEPLVAINGTSNLYYSAKQSGSRVSGNLMPIGSSGTVLDIAPSTGTVIRFLGLIEFVDFSLLNAGGLTGFWLANTTTGTLEDSATNTYKHIGVSVDNLGDLYVDHNNAGTRSRTDSGFNVVSGTRYKLELVWTVGTNAKLYVNDVLRATVTSNLPDRIHYWHMATYTNSGATEVRMHGGILQVELP